MKLHPVEKAFKKHAKKFHCEDFTMQRRDTPDFGVPHKIATGTPDIKITGGYVWAGRNFHFDGLLNTDGMVGLVMLKAEICKPFALRDIETASSVLEFIPGFHPILHASDVPKYKSSGQIFWGIALRILDPGFSDLVVNAHSFSMNETLLDLESHLGIAN